MAIQAYTHSQINEQRAKRSKTKRNTNESLLSKIVTQLKPIEEPVPVSGIYTPLLGRRNFSASGEPQKARAMEAGMIMVYVEVSGGSDSGVDSRS